MNTNGNEGTRMGNERTRMGQEGTRRGNVETGIGTPREHRHEIWEHELETKERNRRQTNTLKMANGVVTQNINFNRNFVVDENDIPYFLTICKPKISEYSKQTILSGCFL